MKTLKTNSEGYNYKYTDLAGIHEYLEKIDTSYYQYVEVIEGNDYVMTIPIVDGKELQPRRGCRVVQATLSGKSNPAQEQGSALTYARRYSLLMAFGLATEDDDGEQLTTRPEKGKNTPVAQSYPSGNSMRPRPTTAPQNGQEKICSNCGKVVDGNVTGYSLKKYGKVLCYDCQKLN